MKHYLNRIAFMAVAGLVGAGILSAAEWDKKTTITTDEAMQVPHTTLPAGTYVVKLADIGSNRHVVQFFDKSETHLITTILAIPNERVRPTGKSVFAFWEVPAGQPKALRAWFYPGDNFGQEFAYPKEEAAQITASNKGATVPVNDEKTPEVAKFDSAATTTTAQAETAPAVAPEPARAAEPAPVASAPEPAPAPAQVATAPQQSEPAPVATADASSDAQRVTATPGTLPKTASNLPLLGLIGLFSMVCAFALKFAYRQN